GPGAADPGPRPDSAEGDPERAPARDPPARRRPPIAAAPGGRRAGPSLRGELHPLPRVQPTARGAPAGSGGGVGPALRPGDPDALFAVSGLLEGLLGGHALEADAGLGGGACLRPERQGEADAG